MELHVNYGFRTDYCGSLLSPALPVLYAAGWGGEQPPPQRVDLPPHSPPFSFKNGRVHQVGEGDREQTQGAQTLCSKALKQSNGLQVRGISKQSIRLQVHGISRVTSKLKAELGVRTCRENPESKTQRTLKGWGSGGWAIRKS